MEIEYWPIDRPVPYSRNPRKIPQSAIDKVAASIEAFGFRQPIVVDRMGTIVVGHSRLAAARKLGMTTVPVHIADLTEAQARAYRIADNRSNEEASWDEGLLKLELAEIGDLAHLTAFDPSELEQFGPARDPNQDPIPPLPVTPVARLGQIWQLGKHRLLCGDSTRREEVARLMGEERALLFQTDPPYAVGYAGGSHPVTKANRGRANRDTPSPDIENDSEVGRDFYLRFIMVAIERAIAPNAAWYCWHASARQAMLEEVWNEVGAFMHQQIIWVKSGPVLTYSIYMWRHEPCMFGWIKGQKPAVERREEGGYPSTAWEVPSGEIETNEHPTSKPNRLFAIPMQLHTQTNDLCYEPFSGSGSQLIAAEQQGRRCYAIELEPRYVDVAVSRWEKLTGNKAEVIAEGDAVEP